MDIIAKAREIAEKAHEDQVRKDDGSPYIAHPIAVSEIVRENGFSDTVIAAALVHDVLEDTPVTETELRNELGDEVVDIVTAVSEDKSLPWEDRKKQYVDQVAAASEETKAVSVADKIHNSRSNIIAHERMGTAVWDVFNVGRDKKLWFERTLCDRLKETWQHPMLDEYESLIIRLESLD